MEMVIYCMTVVKGVERGGKWGRIGIDEKRNG